MLNRSGVLMVAVVAVLCFPAAPVFAADADQSSFSIAPPPIANPVFEANEGHMKVRGTYLTMEGTDPEFPYEITGYGTDFLARKASNSVLAFDGGMGITILDGDMGSDSTISGMSLPLQANVEVQAFKADFMNLILFAGPQFTFSYMNVDMKQTIDLGPYGGVQTSTMYMDMYSIVFGIQAGAQVGFNIMDTVGIDVFGMALNQQGTQSVTYSASGYSDSDSFDIPSYTTTSFGVDLQYIPWGLTLSSVLQEAGKSDSAGTKTKMYQLSWSRKF